MNTNKTVLHHYLPEKLQVVLTHDLTEDYSWQDRTESVNEDSFKEGAIWTLSGFMDPQLMISSGEGELSEYLLQRENRTWISVDSKSFKPALHSMNRLTMPLENGEIPIVEIFKLTVWYLTSNNFKQTKVNQYGLFFTTDNFSGEIMEWNFRYSEAHGFGLTMVEPNYHYENILSNQLPLFQYLINNHFNFFGLSESEYIEKSTLKI